MGEVVERPVQRWPSGERLDDLVAAEEPLEIRVDGEPMSVAMRTPGHDLELVAGLLLAEGIVDGRDDLAGLAHIGAEGAPSNAVDVVLAGGVAAHRDALRRTRRELWSNSACGVCGRAAIEHVQVACKRVRPLVLDPAMLAALPDKLRIGQTGFAASGGLHAAGLFSRDGELEVLREDVGRHNAVDKVLGWRLLQDRVPVDDRVLVVSSRAGFEVVQKAAVAGVPAIVAVGAASSLAVDLAVASGVQLVGFARAGRFNRYA
jgi:FdhD protein